MLAYAGLMALGLLAVGHLLPDGAEAQRSHADGPWAAATETMDGAAAGTLPAPAADIEGLRRRIADIVAAQDLAGAAVAILQDRRVVWMGGFGRASRSAEGGAVDEQTRFRGGSLGKSFLALAAVRLAAEGRLDLNARVRGLVPDVEIENPWEATHPLRFAHLLEHTSGFDEMRFNEVFPRDGREDPTLDEVLAVNPRSRRARWPPGSRFAYAQPGYTVAAAAIERVTRRRYEDALDELVFRPLGLPPPAFQPTAELAAHLARGYERGREVPYRPLLHRPAAGLLVSVRDLARLVELLLGRGVVEGRRFVPEAAVARIERSETLSFAPAETGYGLGNWGSPGPVITWRGHGGFVPGYLGAYRYSPALGSGFVVLTNDSALPAAPIISQAIIAYLLRDHRPQAPPEITLPGAVLARFAGVYDLESPSVEFDRFRTDLLGAIRVELDGERLMLGPLTGSARIPLVPTGPATFRLPRQTATTITFMPTDGDRRAAVAIGDRYYERTNPAWARARLWAMNAALVILFVALAVAPGLFANRRIAHGEAALAAPSFVAALCLAGAWLAFDVAVDRRTAGDLNLATALVFLLTALFPAASLVALRRAVRRTPAPTFAVVRAHAIVTALVCCGLAAYLARYGLVALRTWAW